jgi:UDP-GlcNAc:undecaprenyl-phosphate GlcNAc-1-phosphate transferase
MAASVGTYHTEVRFLLILSASLVGFLLFNFPFPGRKRALAFLGDAGSYLLGLSIMYAVVRLTQGQHPAMPPVSALWFCLLPLLDMGGIMTRRILRRRSPFNADREHLHHVFTLAKFSATETTGAMALIALFGVAIGTMFVFVSVPERGLFLLFLGLAGLYLWMIMRAWRRLVFLKRSIDRRVRNVGPGDEAATDRRNQVAAESANDQLYERRSGQDRRRAKSQEDDEVPVIPPKPRPRGGARAGQGG